MSLDKRYNALRCALDDMKGYRILGDDEVLKQHDETACASMLLSEDGDTWTTLDADDESIRKTVAWANDYKLSGDMDATERLFRRMVKR